MSAWYGLQNHEAHIDEGGDAAPECFDCESMCFRSMLCRCCLQAEVERLTAERDILRAANAIKAERIDAALALLQPDAGGWCDCLAHRIGRALRGESDE